MHPGSGGSSLAGRPDSRAPGVYHEPGQPCPTDPTKRCAVVISLDDLSLIGEEAPGRPVVIENAGGQETGITIAPAGARPPGCLVDPAQRVRRARVEGFTVRQFEGNGILLVCVDDWVVASNVARDNGEYGIFPVFSGRGRIHDNDVSGSNDTGIYVGQSHDIGIDRNVAHDNLSGFEIESSRNVRLTHNEALGNTVGIAVFIEPLIHAFASDGNEVSHNVVHGNNRPNTCPPDDPVCLLPPGIGILVVGGRRNVIAHNVVVDNETFGIALADFCSVFAISPTACAQLDIDPVSTLTEIRDNTTARNGGDPQFPGLPGADLIWSGVGTGNCWHHNRASIVVPAILPSCR